MSAPLFASDRLSQTPFVQIFVVAVEGSAPREAGAYMSVGIADVHGTIGGGQLELEAIAHARKMLATHDQTKPWMRETRVWPLGPALGQCCGGTVRLLFEVISSDEMKLLSADKEMPPGSVIVHPLVSGKSVSVHSDRKSTRSLPLPVSGIAANILSGAIEPKPAYVAACGGEHGWFIDPVRQPPIPLFIYGAGHVGRALVQVVPGQQFDIHWVDTHADRFPQHIPDGVTAIPARTPEAIAAAAPKGSFHLVLTYSHAIDLAICQALLASPDFGFLGLIGSATKRARFLKRLRSAGISSQTLTRLTCPIGIGGLKGKEPATIAVSVAAQLIQQRELIQDLAVNGREGEYGVDKQISA